MARQLLEIRRRGYRPYVCLPHLVHGIDRHAITLKDGRRGVGVVVISRIQRRKLRIAPALDVELAVGFKSKPTAERRQLYSSRHLWIGETERPGASSTASSEPSTCRVRHAR